MSDLTGLILAGGQSRRMGFDKGQIVFRGLPLRVFAYEQVKKAGVGEVFISCREDQISELEGFPVVVDIFPDSGPLGAILSAFEKKPQSAWLVLACDMPLVRVETLQRLISSRNPTQQATAFSDETGRLQPLVSIWEPSILPTVKSVFFTQNRSPRRVLELSDIHPIISGNPDEFANLNDPESLLSVVLRVLCGSNPTQSK
ncbi:MAG: molybdenum cofactor guanylyltransferase [Bacteroidia bacterium]|nr:molybdenum cofactor guanylyltransferase [Bacteroidia bacterium]